MIDDARIRRLLRTTRGRDRASREIRAVCRLALARAVSADARTSVDRARSLCERILETERRS